MTDPETGEQYHIRLRAPPEPEGIQSWHHGIVEGEWADQARGTDHYFAKQEVQPVQPTEIRQLTYGMNEQDRADQLSRARYAEGPPTIKNSFPGFSEYPGVYGGDQNGFHMGTTRAAPDPLTGKEFTPLHMDGRNVAPVGGQQIQALPYEGRHTVKGYADLTDRTAPGSRPIPGASNPFLESIHRANNGASRSVDYSLASLQSQRALNYQREQVSPNTLTSAQPNSAQRMDAASQSATHSSTVQQYSARREQAPYPNSRVALMRFGQPSMFGEVGRGSTRLPPTSDSAGAQQKNYTSLQVHNDFLVASGFHPIESLMMENESLPVSGTLHIPQGGAGAQVQTRPVDVVEPVVQIHADSAPRTEPHTSVRQEFPTAPKMDEPEEDQYKIYSLRTNPETSIRQEFQPVQSAHEAQLNQFKDTKPRTNPETSVRQEFQPVQSTYDAQLNQFKDTKPRTNPETSVMQEFQPVQSAFEARPQAQYPSANRMPGGRSIVGAARSTTAAHVPEVDVHPSQYAIHPHGLYTGHLIDRLEPQVEYRPGLDMYSLLDQSRAQVSDTLTNGSIRTPQRDTSAPDVGYIQNNRTQYIFPAIN